MKYTYLTALLIVLGCYANANIQAKTTNYYEKLIAVSATTTDTFTVSNMGCHNDQALVSRALYRQKGVKKVSALDGKVIVTYDNNKISAQKIISTIEGTGTCENPKDRIYKANKK